MNVGQLADMLRDFAPNVEVKFVASGDYCLLKDVELVESAWSEKVCLVRLERVEK